jgi:asparagine synthase (glutamine-hydrolysing)
MANSLEVRVPLLDHELVELAFRMPPEHKMKVGRTKTVMKDVLRRRIPDELVDRPKAGFTVPIRDWLSTTLRPILEELTSPARLRETGLFRPRAVQRLKREHLEGHADHSHTLWTLMVFEDWRRRWGVSV